jgi:hypothetical protein
MKKVISRARDTIAMAAFQIANAKRGGIMTLFSLRSALYPESRNLVPLNLFLL